MPNNCSYSSEWHTNFYGRVHLNSRILKCWQCLPSNWTVLLTGQDSRITWSEARSSYSNVGQLTLLSAYSTALLHRNHLEILWKVAFKSRNNIWCHPFSETLKLNLFLHDPIQTHNLHQLIAVLRIINTFFCIVTLQFVWTTRLVNATRFYITLHYIRRLCRTCISFNIIGL